MTVKTKIVENEFATFGCGSNKKQRSSGMKFKYNGNKH